MIGTDFYNSNIHILLSQFAMLNNRYPFHYKDRKAMLKEQLDKDYVNKRYGIKLLFALIDTHLNLLWTQVYPSLIRFIKRVDAGNV